MSEHALLLIDTIFGGVGAAADIAIVCLMVREAMRGHRIWPWLVAMALVSVTATVPAYLAYRLAFPTVRESETPQPNGEVPAASFIETSLSLNFTSSTQAPVEVSEKNIAFWYVVHSPPTVLIQQTFDPKKGTVQTDERQTIAPFLNIFIDFKSPTKYQQLLVAAPPSFPQPHVLYSDDRRAVITTQNGDAAGLLQISAKPQD